MAEPFVLIVGAGPTGMTAAIELRRLGLDVRIVDRSDHLAIHSQALALQARTLEQFQRYGIAAEAVARGRKVTDAAIFSEGKQIVSASLSGISSVYPYILMLPQSHTEAILNRKMESFGTRTERGTQLESIDQHKGTITAVLRHPAGGREELEPRWVIGCDGAHSTVREKLGIPFEGDGIGLSFFLGDLQMDGPGVPGDEVSLHFHHGDVIFMARLTEKLVRVVAATHAMQDGAMKKDVAIEDFQKVFQSAGIEATIHSAEWMTPFNVNDRQARHYRLGNVFLAGDASHIHSPVGGQGMNTGIQDAANLAWKIAAVARGAGDALLDSYEEERGEVGRALLRFTERGLKMATATNPVIETLRDKMLPLFSTLHPAQKRILGFISETAISYRSSSIVSDFGGDGYLSAGDRLPDLGLRKGGLNYTLLHDWTEPKHLALLLDPTAAEVAEIKAALPLTTVVTLSYRDLLQEGLRALGPDRKLLIVRPDGYIGFRGQVEPRTPWTEYAEQDAILTTSKVAFQ
ncbi:MAG TPA: FAD-dependent monooxygenase [Terracidiphilus sp.]|nr:FAD-dependent monooxygenase [Terracidiphilus sp.]